MSESEQSWSFHTARSTLQRGRLIVCAMALLDHGVEWPMDQRAFALAVDRQVEAGNPIAKSIRVHDGPAGRSCHEFDDMLSGALSSCLISYVSPAFTTLRLSVSNRMLIKEAFLNGVPDDQIDQAKALVQAFWEEVYGRPEPGLVVASEG